MIPRDIVNKINRDFGSPASADLALSVLEDFAQENQDLSSYRFLRCIVFVANGDLERFDQAINLARIDYRDLIVWAEYNDKFERIRDMNLPFPDNK